MNSIEKIKNFSKKFAEDRESDLTSFNESESEPSNQLIKSSEEEQLFYKKEGTGIGTLVEKYFYLKLKKFLLSTKDFNGNYSLINHIDKIEKSIIEYVNLYGNSNSKESNELKIKGFNLIQKAKQIFKTNSQRLQIDCFFPNIKGNIIKKLYNQIYEYSYFSENFFSSINENESYNLIVESTNNILAQIKKKIDQLEKYYMLFTKTKELYLEDKKILKKFYSEFLNFFKVIENKNEVSEEDLIKNSKNYIYMICTNKNFNDFKEFEEGLVDFETFKKKIQQKNLVKMNKKQKDFNNIKKENENVNIKNLFSPEDYIPELKKILNKISDGKERYIVTYFDCYSNLFIPTCEIKDGIISIKEDYNNIISENEKIKKENEEMKKELNDLKLKQKENEEKKKENEEMKKKYDRMEYELNDLKKQFDDLKKELLTQKKSS